MATFEVFRNGVSTSFVRDVALLTSDSLAWVEAESGVGMAPVARQRQQGPLQHGATDLGFRLQPRSFSLVFGLAAATMAGVYTKRDLLLSLFAPSDSPLQCRWTRDDGAVRQIDCHFAGNLDFASSERLGVSQRTAIQLEAADPTFYDPTGVTEAFGIAATTGAFNVPLAIPWAIGASTVDQIKSVVYPGTWRASPLITIIGPITNPVLTNLTTGEKLDFTGTSILVGDRYIIDTRYGAATVVDAAGVDRIANLTDDSDLTTFHLASAADVVSGVNDLQATGSAATAATQIYVSYNARYLGL